MRILFYYRGAESFAIEQISAILKNGGHTTGLIFDPGFDDTFFFKTKFLNFLNVKKRLLAEARQFKPDIVAFSSITNLYPYIKDMAGLLKKELGIMTVIGGIHATVLPDHVLGEDCFDIVCVGEGEFAMLELADRMRRGRDYSDIKNLWVKQNGRIIKNEERPIIEDLDALPFPDKELFYRKGAFWKSIQAVISRGCFYHCSFCVNDFYMKRYGKKVFRHRSPANVVAQMRLYKQTYRPVFVNFQDNIFFPSISWLEEFSERYKNEVGIGFHVNLHPFMIQKETVALLRRAGCLDVGIGVQSGNEALRRGLLRRNETNDEIKRAVRLLKEGGIHVTSEFIFGLPGETAEQAWESAAFNDALRPDSASTFLYYPFPGTELQDYSYKHGFMDNEALATMREGAGSYHMTLLLKNKNNNLFYNLSYFMPIASKFRWLMRLRRLKGLCESKPNFVHRFVGLCALPLHSPRLFAEKGLNYMRMLLVYLTR